MRASGRTPGQMRPGVSHTCTAQEIMAPIIHGKGRCSRLAMKPPKALTVSVSAPRAAFTISSLRRPWRKDRANSSPRKSVTRDLLRASARAFARSVRGAGCEVGSCGSTQLGERVVEQRLHAADEIGDLIFR